MTINGLIHKLTQMLDENSQLIQTIIDYQSRGKAAECVQYQQILHRNLVYLATIADSSQNVQALLPAPGQTNQQTGISSMGQRPSGPILNQGSAMPPANANNINQIPQMNTPSSYSNGPPSSQPNQPMSGQNGHYNRPGLPMNQQQAPPMMQPQGQLMNNQGNMPSYNMPGQPQQQPVAPVNFAASQASQQSIMSAQQSGNSPIMNRGQMPPPGYRRNPSQGQYIPQPGYQGQNQQTPISAGYPQQPGIQYTYSSQQYPGYHPQISVAGPQNPGQPQNINPQNQMMPGQGPASQMPGQGPPGQMPGQTPSAQMPGQGASSQLSGQVPVGQVPGQCPQGQIQPQNSMNKGQIGQINRQGQGQGVSTHPVQSNSPMPSSGQMERPNSQGSDSGHKGGSSAVGMMSTGSLSSSNPMPNQMAPSSMASSPMPPNPPNSMSAPMPQSSMTGQNLPGQMGSPMVPGQMPPQPQIGSMGQPLHNQMHSQMNMAGQMGMSMQSQMGGSVQGQMAAPPMGGPHPGQQYPYNQNQY
ncbi:uncharacterized protein LOC141901887 isoform X2 [Tubulanus polymorphus]|uniref:uncharacterized protein LOC141901887 isoform X2 n=1 Tax=Tubulanus polymorphus TaxID=672921 RepID=UPI003DA655EB